ncbi:hypothetical protein GWR56_13230 [Mucilaginibacter sp. 14171R-50]|uniref:hypothetical protein n=1 Tax=Mucilaginibacter sp. 14171R-50 TaxID=2703789 RepID=UPI00138CD313|nr:hypothetical protein [Mucilaginibacter sp. 14171R-50]QHS56453.1 hypothetical protein GWR56_13230 [Mucilaginibacter sp. 14171R-50]
MKQQLFIIDKPLPETQDFQALKSAGLAFLKEHSGGEWTNFNASDPGVTILDQVCFALTELGYCNDFPIEDILTDANGRIVTNDQFYLPQAILTISPFTTDDYRKYLIDSNKAIKNAILIVYPSIPPFMRYIYQSYLLLDERLTETEKNDVCTEAYYYLNKSRNAGELFFTPRPFQNLPFSISGNIEINSTAPVNQILTEINSAIQQYIFPAAVQHGFEQLRQQRYNTQDILDGPVLNNGWFTNQTLGTPKAKLNTMELMEVISKVKGVSEVGQLSIYVCGQMMEQIILSPSQLPVLDCSASLSSGLRITYKGAVIPADYKFTGPVKPRGINTGNVYLDMENENSQVKPGVYRDIESYYSIQNTFPAIFSIGGDVADGNTTKYSAAQSRQLKAYLTLFDQVLANQFAQLAGTGRLFSFRNSLTADTLDEVSYYSTLNAEQRVFPEYPAPYVCFSPTYFYRSLYDVPNIRPLLKDNDVKRFYTGQQTQKELDYDSWEAFKHDPYNAYIHGLSAFMEDENTSITRRNAMLDHLLARHGESPLTINEMLKGSVYSGNGAKDLVIFKSLYLQNLGLLSYFRYKGYNMLAAKKIAGLPKAVPTDFEHQILNGNDRDFIFDATKIDELEKLTVTDFDNYSAIELKMCLFFGLRMLYLNFILCNFDKAAEGTDLRHALWMITERKGLIFIENCLLQRNVSYQIVITREAAYGPYLQVAGELDYNQAWEVVQALTDNKQHLDDYEYNGLDVNGIHYRFLTASGEQQRNKYFKQIPHSAYYFTVKIDGKKEVEKFDEFPVFKSDVEFIFPDFILPTDKPAFEKRIQYFLQQSLPVHLTYDVHFLGTEQLEAFIPAFVYWHNQLIFKPKHYHEAA